jgi:NAD(P)-dependent dehydrogenase (short-subunit alcohol dehydrogenase family)
VSAGRFAGQVAVVTGAGNGIGRGSAERLAAEGARVVVVDIDGDAAMSTAAALPGGAIAVTADVSDEAQVDAYIEAAVGAFGRIDFHHLNAGIFGTFAKLPDLPADEFDRVLAVNVRGQFLGLRAAFRQYRAQGADGTGGEGGGGRDGTGGGGAIVVTASIASLTGSADLLAYQTSKHATVGLVHGAAMYGGPLGIRVNAVAPGIIWTPRFAEILGPAGRRANEENTPLGHIAQPAEIASAILFLTSRLAAHITGQTLVVDGGVNAKFPYPAVNMVRKAQ